MQRQAPVSSLFLEQPEPNPIEDEGEVSYEMDEEGTMGVNRYAMGPGDAIELIRPTSTSTSNTQFAVYVKSVGVQDLFIIEDGRYVTLLYSRLKSYPVKRFVDPSIFEPLLPHLPSDSDLVSGNLHGQKLPVDTIGDLAPALVATLRQELSRLKEEVLSFRREYVHVMERTNDLLAHEDQWRIMNVEDCIEELLGKSRADLTPGALLAFHKVVETDPTGCQIAKQIDQGFIIILTPKALVRKFDQVQEWTRQYQEAAAQASLGKNVQTSLSGNPLSTFIDKARRIILKSRKIRSPTTIGNLGPSSGYRNEQGRIAKYETGEKFTENDYMIIEFIWNAFLRKPRVMFNGAAKSTASVIMRAIGAYPSLRLEAKIGRLLLQELGVRPPWAEISDEDVSLPVPGRRNGAKAERLFRESEEQVIALKMNQTRKIPFVDKMAHLRRDFGDTTVYCLDSHSSRILDDGFSVEPDESLPGAYRLYAHIAHPSAFLDKGHIFAQRAAHYTSSLFTSRQSYPMLPYNFALAVSLEESRMTLSVSGLIMPDGEVRDTRIEPTKINRIVRILPEAVDRILGLHQEDDEATFVLGSLQDTHARTSQSKKVAAADLELAESHRSTLEIIRKLCELRYGRRRHEVTDYLNAPYANVNANTWVSFTEEYSGKIDHSQHYVGDPILSLTSRRRESIGLFSDRCRVDTLITQVMHVCSEMAARWCHERKIPGIYQGSEPQGTFTTSKLSKTEPNLPSLHPVSRFSATAIPHVLINCSEYMRFTSPLRRYHDLLNHWQVDGFLRNEAKFQDGLVTPDTETLLPFPQQFFEDYIKSSSARIRELEKLMKRSRNHWMFQAFFRAFHFKEAQLPEVWDMRIGALLPPSQHEGDTGIRGRLIPFHLEPVKVLRSDAGFEKTATYGHYLPVKIELVDVEMPCLWVKAVGPPSTRPTTTEPIHIRPHASPEDEALKKQIFTDSDAEKSKRVRAMDSDKEARDLSDAMDFSQLIPGRRQQHQALA